MRPESKAMLNALLEHQARQRRAGDSAKAPFSQCLLTYNELCELAGVPHVAQRPGEFLFEIAQWCSQLGLPPLNSLVVHDETRTPGAGYGQAPGCSLRNWPEEAQSCLEFAEYPKAS